MTKMNYLITQGCHSNRKLKFQDVPGLF